MIKEEGDRSIIFPDSVLGTDSHTTMVNGLGVLGWGVGGIEALAAMLGYPSEFTLPDVVGVEFSGRLPEGVTPTDLTLTLTSRLRTLGVVNKFVEVFGPGCAELPVETRAMIANMSPESGATATYFPVDDQTLDYLRRTGRSEDQVELVGTYFRTQMLFREDNGFHPEFSHVMRVNLGKIQSVMAGPKRPQDVFLLSNASQTFKESLQAEKGNKGFGLSETEINKKVLVTIKGQEIELAHGAVLIAAITSCTNTSDPGVLITAALLAKNAAAKGLRSKPWVKTSFAPGSRAVKTYLSRPAFLVAWRHSVFISWVTAAPPALETPDRLTQPLAMQSGITAWSAPLCFRATGILKGAFTRTPEPVFWQRLHWLLLMLLQARLILISKKRRWAAILREIRYI